MINSLTVFLAFLAFLAFGYFSLLRTLYGQLFASPFKELTRGLSNTEGLKHIGSSAFFVSLPATSLLLFWGWGPALLWLVVFHLLVDSLVNLQVTAVEHESTLSEYLVNTDSAIASLLLRGLLQIYLVLLLSVVLTMLAQLIDKESGLLFALIGLIPAYQLLRNNNRSIPNWFKRSGAFLMLAMGFVVANQLGFAMYGDWAPLGDTLNWFRFNNSTVLALILLVGGFALANNEEFSADVAKLAGVIVIAAIIILAVKLIWLRPLLDAPLNSISESTENLPFFISFCLFLFAGLITLFFRVFNSTAPTDVELTPAADFGRVQAESILQLLLALLIVLCLASALGIGAWKTHYLNWDDQGDFFTHLSLTIRSLLHLIHSGATAGNFMHTALMAGLCIAGLNFLRVCIKALSLAHEVKLHRIGESQTFLQVVVQSRLIQAFAAFLISCYLLAHGISLDLWFLIGIISWVIVVQLITAMTVSMSEATFARLAYGTQCLFLMSLGALQTLWMSIRWISGGDMLFAIAGLALLATGAYLWWTPVKEIASRFGKSDSSKLFDTP